MVGHNCYKDKPKQVGQRRPKQTHPPAKQKQPKLIPTWLPRETNVQNHPRLQENPSTSLQQGDGHTKSKEAIQENVVFTPVIDRRKQADKVNTTLPDSSDLTSYALAI